MYIMAPCLYTSADDIQHAMHCHAVMLQATRKSCHFSQNIVSLLQDEALVGEWGVGAMAANPDELIPDSDETHRLAIVDLDWDKIRAVDLLAVLRSFLGTGQTIRGVAVYPSDFGLQKMKVEAAVGPQVGVPFTL